MRLKFSNFNHGFWVCPQQRVSKSLGPASWNGFGRRLASWAIYFWRPASYRVLKSDPLYDGPHKYEVGKYGEETTKRKGVAFWLTFYLEDGPELVFEYFFIEKYLTERTPPVLLIPDVFLTIMAYIIRETLQKWSCFY